MKDIKRNQAAENQEKFGCDEEDCKDQNNGLVEFSVSFLVLFLKSRRDL